MKIVSGAYKPSSVLDGHLSRPAVASGLKRFPGSVTGRHICFPINLAPRRRGCSVPPFGTVGPTNPSLSVLHRIGFAEPRGLPRAGELLPRLSTLAFPCGSSRYISVALSLKSPPPAVNRHPALRCSDFPQAVARLRPSGILTIITQPIRRCRPPCKESGRSCRIRRCARSPSARAASRSAAA